MHFFYFVTELIYITYLVHIRTAGSLNHQSFDFERNVAIRQVNISDNTTQVPLEPLSSVIEITPVVNPMNEINRPSNNDTNLIDIQLNVPQNDPTNNIFKSIPKEKGI